MMLLNNEMGLPWNLRRAKFLGSYDAAHPNELPNGIFLERSWLGMELTAYGE